MIPAVSCYMPVFDGQSFCCSKLWRHTPAVPHVGSPDVPGTPMDKELSLANLLSRFCQLHFALFYSSAPFGETYQLGQSAPSDTVVFQVICTLQ